MAHQTGAALRKIPRLARAEEFDTTTRYHAILPFSRALMKVLNRELFLI
jgi:hypothetical protein